MKRLILKLSLIAITLLAIHGLSSCKQEEEFDIEGLLLLNVQEEYPGNPVAQANVKVYQTLDDWAFEVNEIQSFQTDETGSIILNKLKAGEYYFDIKKEALNNWHLPYGVFVEDGQVSFASITIFENINGVISSVEGKTWAITSITDISGNDISGDPNYSCLLDNTYLFQKSGFFSLNEGSAKCNASAPVIREGSWASDGYYSLYTHYGGADPDIFLEIVDLTHNSFTAIQTTNSGIILLGYEHAP